MNSSFSTVSDSLLETLASILDMLPELHTVGFEFTVIRHESWPVGFEINIQCLLTAQKSENNVKKPKKNVE